MAGSYNEAKAFETVKQLKALRGALDSGQISVSDFLKQGKPLAEFVVSEGFRLGGSGSGGANVARTLMSEFQGAGFTQDSADQRKVITDLPQEYQQSLREELLPKNISAEEKARLLADIPDDIGFDTDRFQIEKEGIRQRTQAEKEAAEITAKREASRAQLAELLSKQSDDAFDANRANILEDLNARGLFRSSGVGKAFADERARQDMINKNVLQGQSIADTNADISGFADIGASQRAFQTSGLDREFSLDDSSRSLQMAMQLAQLNKPSNSSGKTSGEKWNQGISTGAQVVGAFLGKGK